MASVEGLKRKVKEYKPVIQSAFMVYLGNRDNAVGEFDPTFKVIHVTSPDDPLLDQIVQKWQMKYAKKSLAAKELRIIVATLAETGEPIGWIWETFATQRGLFTGVPRVRLAPHETFMFDLFVKREWRRSNIGMMMAHHFYDIYAADKTDVELDYVFGFISYENGPSVLWHYAVGFNIAQTMNYLAVGPRIKWKIPFSDNPRFGPMSRKGRHTDPDKALFGTSLFPQG